MDKAQKILNLLGMAQRAGRLVSGDFAAEKEIKNGRGLYLAFLAKDSGGDNEKKYSYLAEETGVPVNRMFTKAELGVAIGKEKRVIVLVKDKGFAEAILKLMR